MLFCECVDGARHFRKLSRLIPSFRSPKLPPQHQAPHLCNTLMPPPFLSPTHLSKKRSPSEFRLYFAIFAVFSRQPIMGKQVLDCPSLESVTRYTPTTSPLPPSSPHRSSLPTHPQSLSSMARWYPTLIRVRSRPVVAHCPHPPFPRPPPA